MKLHANAALSLRQRERMVLGVVEHGWSPTQAAATAEVSGRTCSKWVARYPAERAVGLLDRSSAPAGVANRTDERAVQVIAALRRLRFTGPEIAEVLDRPLSTWTYNHRRRHSAIGRQPPITRRNNLLGSYA